jgi:sulfoquinovose isomerase
VTGDGRFELGTSSHVRWLEHEAARLLDHYARWAPDWDLGGFHWVGEDGPPQPGRGKELWINARMVHVFSLAELAGRVGAGAVADHGLRFLRGPLYDAEEGGWFDSVDVAGRPDETSKSGYGHAFVLLAAASALVADRPGAAELLTAADEVIDRRFWRADDGLAVERSTRDWSTFESYRGQNSNMHLTEAYLAAADATGEQRYLDRAEGIARRLIRGATAANDWRLPEHFDEQWRVVPDYHRDRPGDPFRPYGSTIGHWLEWSRLLLQVGSARGEADDWHLDAAVRLFDGATREGWDANRPGFLYTVDWEGRPVVRDRYHWVAAEAIGAAVALHRATGDDRYRHWYAEVWRHVDEHLIDRQGGGWFHQLDPDNRPTTTVWEGRPDLYHAYQATLFARIPGTGGLAAGLRDAGWRPAAGHPGAISP